MARAYKCDRCGAFYGSATNAGKIATRRYDWSNATREHDDLCEKCTQELAEWFEAGKMDLRTQTEAALDAADSVMMGGANDGS